MESTTGTKTFWSKNIKDLKMQQVVSSCSFDPHYFKILEIIPFFP